MVRRLCRPTFDGLSIVYRLLKKMDNKPGRRSRGGMICPRCHCLLVEDRFMDWTARWRCLKCGHVQDSLSVESYLKHQEKAFFVKSSEPDYLDEEVLSLDQLGLFPGPVQKQKS
jgi:hypothetical protein